MPHTPWTKPAQRSHGGSVDARRSSGLTSDLLVHRGGSSKKVNDLDYSYSPSEPKKSREIDKLEKLIEAVGAASYQAKYPKEGCFCRARKHTLSHYVPLCTHCGLVLCKLQHPAFPCPSCRSSLYLQPSSRPSALARLNAELKALLKREEEAREKERVEQLQREVEAAGGGAFPVLQPSGGSPHAHLTSTQPHKVLSLNSTTKTVTLSTISRKTTPVPPRPSAAEVAAEEEEFEDVVSRAERQTRVPPPKAIPEHAQRKGTERRWEPLQGNGAIYVQPPRMPTEDNEGSLPGSSKKRRKGKGKTSEAPNVTAESVENPQLPRCDHCPDQALTAMPQLYAQGQPPNRFIDIVERFPTSNEGNSTDTE